MNDSNPTATQTAEEVIERVREQDVRFIRLWFTDVLGQLKSFSINASELEDAFEGGMGFDGSSITGFNPIEESDMIAMPDPSTFALLPWRPEKDATARMFCDIQVPGGEPYEGDPRWILQRALKRAEDLGFDDFNIGPELEFFYFKFGAARGRDPRGPRRGRLLRPDHARRRLRRPPRDGPRARAAWASTSSTPTTRSAPPSTRSTCATRTRSRWPTTA